VVFGRSLLNYYSCDESARKTIVMFGDCRVETTGLKITICWIKNVEDELAAVEAWILWVVEQNRCRIFKLLCTLTLCYCSDITTF